MQVLFLALRMPLDGIVPQIMSLPPHMLEAKPEDPLAAPGAVSFCSSPPTLLAYPLLSRSIIACLTTIAADSRNDGVRCMFCLSMPDIAELGSSAQARHGRTRQHTSCTWSWTAQQCSAWQLT